MITILLIVVVGLVLALLLFGTLIQLLVAVAMGIIFGAIACMLMPGKQNLTWWQTAIVGVLGSLPAGILGALVDLPALAHALLSIVGAVAVLLLFGRARAARLFCIGGLIGVLACTGCAKDSNTNARSGSVRDQWQVVFIHPDTGKWTVFRSGLTEAEAKRVSIHLCDFAYVMTSYEPVNEESP